MLQVKRLFARHATARKVASSCTSLRSGQYRIVSQLINAIELNRNISRPFFRRVALHYIKVRAFCACKWRYTTDGGCRRTSESYCVYAQDTLAPSVTFSTFHPCCPVPLGPPSPSFSYRPLNLLRPPRKLRARKIATCNYYARVVTE